MQGLDGVVMQTVLDEDIALDLLTEGHDVASPHLFSTLPCKKADRIRYRSNQNV